MHPLDFTMLAEQFSSFTSANIELLNRRQFIDRQSLMRNHSNFHMRNKEAL